MKWVLLLIPILLIAGCTQTQDGAYTAPPEQQQTPETASATPEDAARAYTSATYFDTDNTKYSDFSYGTETLSTDAAKVTVRFKIVTATPSYSVTQIREQIITVEKKGDAWAATSTPNARVIEQTYG